MICACYRSGKYVIFIVLQLTALFQKYYYVLLTHQIHYLLFLSKQSNLKYNCTVTHC